METKNCSHTCRIIDRDDESFNDVVFGIISRYFVSEIVDAIWRDEFGMIKLDNSSLKNNTITMNTLNSQALFELCTLCTM